MGKLLLLLRLEGPLQAWGLRSRWDVRDTGEEPSKSGIVGLLGCALGYPVSDSRLEELEQQLTLGIRVDKPGSRLIDYQTVSGVLPTASGGFKGTADEPSTIVSPRAYLQDAAFLAVLAGPDAVLRQCRDALAAPVWPVYLGRKACPPSRPVLGDLSEEYVDIEDALRRHPWDAPGQPPEQGQQLLCVLEDQMGAALRPDRLRVNPARMYGSRSVRVFATPFPGLEPPLERGADNVPDTPDLEPGS